MKTKTINQVGIVISGTASLQDWDGRPLGDISMESYFLPNEFITPKNILRCVNDNGFGCKGITSADIDISIKYDNGNVEFDRTLWNINRPQFTKFFLGWSHLRQIGAIK